VNELVLSVVLTASFALTSLCGTQEVSAGEKGGAALALRARKIVTCSFEGAQAVDDGVLVVRDGKIVAVGPASEVALPVDCRFVDVGESWLVPGFIDLHCHCAGPDLFSGKNDINDLVYVTQPEQRVGPAVTLGNNALKLAVAGGVTTVLFIPGSGSNCGGQGVLLKTGFERWDEALVRDPGSLKVAQWGNPESYLGGVGKTWENWHLRQMFRQGAAYARAWSEHEAGNAPKPRKDLRLDVFRELADKRTQVSVHTQVYQVVLMTITMIRGEFGLDTYIDHGEWAGYLTAPLAQKMGVNAIIGPREIETPTGRFFDTDGQIQGIAAEYQKRGHTMIGFNTDSPVVDEHQLFLQAAVACRYGFDATENQGLRGLTIVPAITAGIADRVGSLEPGKDADVLVVTGNPLDPRTAVEQVLIEGRKVYDAAQGRRF
jgi:imidazolonepropionase-like amidohydrolase